MNYVGEIFLYPYNKKGLLIQQIEGNESWGKDHGHAEPTVSVTYNPYD